MSDDEQPEQENRRLKHEKATLARVAAWLTDSPVKTILVSTISSLVFLGGVGGAGWTKYKEHMESELKVTVRVHAVEAFATMRLVTAAQMAGMESATAGSPLMNMGAQLPIIAATVEVENPTANSVNVRECTLTVRDKGAKPVSSEKNYSIESIKDMMPEAPSIWKIEPRSVIFIERFYAFSQASDVANKLSDSSLDLERTFEVKCLVGDRVIGSEPFNTF